jgi:hypothetical protein
MQIPAGNYFADFDISNAARKRERNDAAADRGKIQKSE